MAETGVWERLARLRVPLGFVCGGVVFWLAQPTMTTIAAGGVIALAGESLRVWASGHLNKAREVTSSGPYQWIAHPLYAGSATLGVGLAVASGRWAVAGVVAVYLVATLTAAIRREESFLRRTFGDAHARYRAGAINSAGRFRVSQAIANGEHRTIVGILVAMVLLLVKALSGV